MDLEPVHVGYEHGYDGERGKVRQEGSPAEQDEAREATQRMADDLFAVVGSGQVKIRIDQRYPLADVAQAHRDLEARKTTGCTILTL